MLVRVRSDPSCLKQTGNIVLEAKPIFSGEKAWKILLIFSLTCYLYNKFRWLSLDVKNSVLITWLRSIGHFFVVLVQISLPRFTSGLWINDFIVFGIAVPFWRRMISPWISDKESSEQCVTGPMDDISWYILVGAFFQDRHLEGTTRQNNPLHES